MRISEALERHSRVRYNLTNSDDKEAVDIAFAALRQESNEPLPIECLRQMDGEPVFIVSGMDSWLDIVSFAGPGYLYLRVGEEMSFGKYGDEWTAFGRKPDGF